MKKLVIIIIAFLGLVVSGYAQDSSIFDKFEDYDDVTTVVVTKKAFTMLGKLGSESKEGEEFKEMVGGLEGLKVFTTEDEGVASEMQTTFNSYLKSSKLEELMRVKDKDANVKIYVKEGRDDDHVSEFLMLVDNMKTNGADDPKVVIISIVGDIDLNNISKITSKMDIPGGEHMKNAEK
jgi:hypothetical protein